jgi:hypothetical protein
MSDEKFQSKVDKFNSQMRFDELRQDLKTRKDITRFRDEADMLMDTAFLNLNSGNLFEAMINELEAEHKHYVARKLESIINED